MLSQIMQLAEPALKASGASEASRVFFEALKPLGASYLQTRHYRRPASTLTSASHFAAGGVVARIAPTSWPNSQAFNYICFEQNPLLSAIRQGRTRYLFSDFAPHHDKQFGTYWEAFSQANIADAICATSYGNDNAISSLHLGFEQKEFAPNILFALQMAGLVLTEKIMSLGELQPPAPIRLTPRERDCMAFVSEGKTDWEISVILGVSDATIRFHIDNARRKLSAINRTQAVAKLINLRMI